MKEAFPPLLPDASCTILRERIQFVLPECMDCPAQNATDKGDNQFVLHATDCLNGVELKGDLSQSHTYGNKFKLDYISCGQSPKGRSVRKVIDVNIPHPTGIDLNVSAEDAPGMLNQIPSYPHKHLAQLNVKQSSGYATSKNALESNEPLKIWQSMKENGFLSSSHGGIPIPKQHPSLRKQKRCAWKKKKELIKREPVDRFAKVAAPSGFLSGLNPGIINHVRNSNQVYAIIKALAKSEKPIYPIEEKPEILTGRTGGKHFGNEKDLGNAGFNNVNAQECSDNADSAGADSEAFEQKMSLLPQISGCFPTGKLSIDMNIPLSLKAATVASQWLELLNKDISGRLTALKRSKKRARTLIQMKLPFLLGEENSSCSWQSTTTSNAHVLRWRHLFVRMENILLEEGEYLEEWLREIQEMRKYCDEALLFYSILGQEGFQHLRSKMQSLERESAIKAAAASIYSTSNLAITAGNVPCF